MPRLLPPLPLSRRAGQKASQQAGRRANTAVAATMAVSIALLLSGCATPVPHPKVDVPTTFAATNGSGIEPEAAWWGTFNDPGVVRPGSSRGRGESRYQDGRRTSSCRTCRADGQSLFPVPQCQRSGRRSQTRLRLQRRHKADPARRQGQWRGPGRLVGGRSQRPPACGCSCIRCRCHGCRRQRTRRTPDGDVGRRQQLLHLGRCAPSARHLEGDFGGPSTKRCAWSKRASTSA